MSQPNHVYRNQTVYVLCVTICIGIKFWNCLSSCVHVIKEGGANHATCRQLFMNKKPDFQSCGSLFRSAVEFQTTELPPAKRQRIITMNVPWSSYNFRIESLTQKLLYAKCCYTPFIFLDLETDWVMRRRKSFLEVFSTRGIAKEQLLSDNRIIEHQAYR
ncbi:hypothetical protein YC2023_010045 [Brassica napus]